MADTPEIKLSAMPDVWEEGLAEPTADIADEIKMQMAQERLAAKHTDTVAGELLTVGINGLGIETGRTQRFIFWALGSYLGLEGSSERMFESVWRYVLGQRTNEITHAMGYRSATLHNDLKRIKMRLHKGGFPPKFMQVVYAQFLDDEERLEFIARLRHPEVPEQSRRLTE